MKTHAEKNGEIRLRARAVSRGVAIGKAVCLHGDNRQYFRRDLAEEELEREVRRFHAAVRLAKIQLTRLNRQKTSDTQREIFETHILFLEDKSLQLKIEAEIRDAQINAEWAVKKIADRYQAIYRDFADEHLRDRRIDLEDVTERILTALGGGEKTPLRLEKNSIIVAKELKPSTLVELGHDDLTAIIAESGGWTSHSFIIAREMNLPAVTNLKGILRQVTTGETIIVDGFNGQVILHPSAETLDEFSRRAQDFRRHFQDDSPPVDGILKTLDGREITIRANLDISEKYAQAKRYGAKGVGLFRSEFLYNQNQDFPSEAEQIEAYRKIAEVTGDEGVRVRTFDISAEHLGNKLENEKNPALGLRAVRFSLTDEVIFRGQIRALLAASADRKLDIVLPMISDVDEISRVREIIRQEKESLETKQIPIGAPRLGAMIEVPSAVFMVDEIAAEVDFLSLGTNDLVQYLLAVDRDNAAVADWFRTLHPAVLRAIRQVVEAGEKRGIPVVVCGEMAGSPVYAPILIGLGATELSMNINSIGKVRRIVSNIAFEEARQIAQKLQTCKTAVAVERAVGEMFSEKWAHLFPPDFFPQS